MNDNRTNVLKQIVFSFYNFFLYMQQYAKSKKVWKKRTNRFWFLSWKHFVSNNTKETEEKLIISTVKFETILKYANFDHGVFHLCRMFTVSNSSFIILFSSFYAKKNYFNAMLILYRENISNLNEYLYIY